MRDAWPEGSGEDFFFRFAEQLLHLFLSLFLPKNYRFCRPVVTLCGAQWTALTRVTDLNHPTMCRFDMHRIVPETDRVFEVLIDDETDGNARQNIGLQF
jgi:hypothetical protein